MTDINDLVDQWVKNGLPNTLRGLAADVWDQCSEQWISDLSYDVSAPANPYRIEPKPAPTYDEIYRHLDLSHNWRADRMRSLENLVAAHDEDHARGHVRHDKDDLS